MAAKRLPDARLLRQLLIYEAETGRLFWKPRSIRFFIHAENPEAAWQRWNEKNAENEAFTTVANDGYKRGGIFNTLYLAHRVIVCMKTGQRDGFWVRHRNDVRIDNRWPNLLIEAALSIRLSN